MQSVNSNTFHLHKAKIMSATMTLPDHFEVVVIGTGITESVIAAAASRLGHSVLHIDTSGYYGGDSASFTLEGLLNWADQTSSEKSAVDPKTLNTEENTSKEELSNKTTDTDLLKEGEEIMQLGDYKSVHSVEYKWQEPDIYTSHTNIEDDINEVEKEGIANTQETQKVDEAQEDEAKQDDETKQVHETREGAKDPTAKHGPSKKIWSKELLMDESRRFNLDLNARLLYARGAMVELLISSNISRYTEFKSVTRVLTQIGGRLEHVPSSRSDVFATKHITVVEKRILMKFLSFCANEKLEDILEGKEHKSFTEFLSEENLTQNLIHFVVHSIAMVKRETGVREGLIQTNKFLSSLGRFGSTPFLWSMYGTGELPQAFCRLCAVFGGVYYLGRNMSGLIVKEGRCVAVISEGKRINLDFLVLPDKNTPQNILKQDLKQITTRRGIYINDSSVLAAEKEQITLLSLPSKEPIHVIEVGPGTAACPKGLQVVHASSLDTEEEDCLDKVDELLTPDSRLFSLTFKMSTRTGDVSTQLSNVYRASGPLPELDFDLALKEAETIYSSIYPGEEFLPRAPDPEEIIIGEENEEKTKEDHNSKTDKDKDDISEDINEQKKEEITDKCDSVQSEEEHPSIEKAENNI